MGPLLLRPNYISPVWSGPRVNKARGLAGETLYGESFDVSVHEGLVNVVEGGPFDGVPLDELVRAHRAARRWTSFLPSTGRRSWATSPMTASCRSS